MTAIDPTTLQFVDALYGPLAGTDADRIIAVATAPRFAATFVRAGDLASVASTAHDLDARRGTTGVFVSCCPLRRRPPSGRGVAEDAGAVVAMWADLDVAGGGHSDRTPIGLPRFSTLEAALDAAVTLLEPSAVVRTGGGLQAWWYLTEPWLLDDEADLAEADVVVTRWARALTHVAAASGYGIDDVGDLARVLRVPGTTNRKAGRPQARVELLACDPGLRYLIEDLDDAVPTEAYAAPPPLAPAAPRSPSAKGAYGPADAVNEAASWGMILEPHAWRFFGLGGPCRVCGQRREYWAHPAVPVDGRGRPDHLSASCCHAMKVHSSNPAAAFPPKGGGLTRFEVYAFLNWPEPTLQASMRSAARALRAHRPRVLR